MNKFKVRYKYTFHVHDTRVIEADSQEDAETKVEGLILANPFNLDNIATSVVVVEVNPVEEFGP